MKKKSYYLQMYYSWIVLGRMPDDGLCNSVNTELLKLFEPSAIESRRLERKGYCPTFWASGVPIGSDPKNELSGFTPLRQTIVLFLAAMNDELMKRSQPQFESGPFPYYYANQKPGLSKGCKRAIWFLLMIMIFIAGGLILANADAIDVWMNQ